VELYREEHAPDGVQRITGRCGDERGREAAEEGRQVLGHGVKQTELHCHVGRRACVHAFASGTT